MPYSYEIAAPSGCIVVSWRGVTSVAECQAFIEEIVEDPEFERGHSSLHDLRGITKHLSSAQIQRLAFTISNLKGVQGESRAAFLADDDLTIGMASMLEGRSARTKVEILVTRDARQAKAYIGLADDYVLPADR